MSTLMFWNKQNNANNNSNGNGGGAPGGDAKNGVQKKEWLHAPDTLVNGHVAYLVKFLGATPVDQAKGIDTVKDAIRRLQFTQQIKKADGPAGKKSHKVELTISVDGVAVQEPRGQTVLHQFPLHDISYCADEKGVKKFFSFIAKTGSGNKEPSSEPNHSSGQHDTNNGTAPDSTTTSAKAAAGDETHTCFVFISSKLASDITMTIGQAFELAYRRYVSVGTKDTELSKLQLHARQLENTVQVYQQRLKDLAGLLPNADVARLLATYGVRDMLEVKPLAENGGGALPVTTNGNKPGGRNDQTMGTADLLMANNNDDQLLIETSSSSTTTQQPAAAKMFGLVPAVPPRNQLQMSTLADAFKPSVGTKLEGLLLHSDSDSDFDPRADESDTSSSHTNGGGKQQQQSNDLFGFEPPSNKQTTTTLGQQLFAAPAKLSNGGGGQQQQAAGSAIVNGNGSGYQTSSAPTPLLAPPPKSITPRRPPANGNASASNNNNGSQDLFGSTPFDAMQPSPFDDVDGAQQHSSEQRSDQQGIANEFSNCVRDSSTVFASYNPFGDRNPSTMVCLNQTSNSAFGESFDRGFDAIAAATTTTTSPNASAASSGGGDPFAAMMATSSPALSLTAESAGQAHQHSAELNGINFSGASLAPASPSSESGEPKSTAINSAKPASKPNYNIFYTTAATETQPTIDHAVKSAAASADIFQSVAASAFQEFGNAVPTGAGFARKHVGDHVVATTAHHPPAVTSAAKNISCKTMASCSGFSDANDLFGTNNSVQTNFNKTTTMSIDDFTLESLDPLRK